MKTFEEKWTAWLDGELTSQELVDFEASLPDKATAEIEKQEALKLGSFLKEHLAARPMTNEEFFHHQLRGQIERESSQPTSAREPRLRESWWSIGRLVSLGAICLALFGVCTFFVMREEPTAGRSGYFTQVINARVDPAVSPDANISIFETKGDKVTFLWVNGLESLPSEYAAK